MLDLGFTVAHTAYIHRTFEQADVIADTPIFSDYKLLDEKYPDSKFIYLYRDLNLWLPSIKQLLDRMYDNVVRDDGGFNLTIKRCYKSTFHPFTKANINNDDFLEKCFYRHQQGIEQYFSDRNRDLLKINVNDAASYQQLLTFLDLKPDDHLEKSFKEMNKAGKVTAWNKIKHPLKIASTNNGRVDNI